VYNIQRHIFSQLFSSFLSTRDSEMESWFKRSRCTLPTVQIILGCWLWLLVSDLHSFSALTILAGWQEGHRARITPLRRFCFILPEQLEEEDPREKWLVIIIIIILRQFLTHRNIAKLLQGCSKFTWKTAVKWNWNSWYFIVLCGYAILSHFSHTPLV